MGILRIKQASVEELIDKDPYEFFSLDEPHTLARRFRSEIWGAAFIGVLASFILAALAFWHLAGHRNEVDDQSFAYFEIKVIDHDGHPVPGALVREGERPLGVTDSFGEWRRFLHVQPGTTMAFMITKKNSRGVVLSAVKNMAVPPSIPEGVELELTGSVQLGKLHAEQKPAAERPISGAALMPESGSRQGGVSHPKATEVSIDAPVDLEAQLPQEPLNKRPEAESATPGWKGPEPKPTPSARAAANLPLPSPRAELDEKSSVATSASPPTEISFDAVAISAEVATDPRLADVFAYLTRRSKELGLQIVADAPWRIKLRHLDSSAENGGESGLILVEGSYQTGQRSDRLFAYLRNYQEDMLQTARDILWSVTQHVRKAHRVHREGERWTLRSPTIRLWQLSAGRLLEDSSGKLHKIVLDPAGGDRLLLATSSHSPCLGTSECDVTTLGVQRLPPIGGWQRMKLRVLGPLAADADVFVSGYLATKRSGNLFEYWGAPTGSVNVTLVSRGQLLYRERLSVGPKGEVSLSLPQAPISLR